ncbi:MAG: hypothetical protein ACLTKG_04725 [Collinsella intestinalis]
MALTRGQHRDLQVHQVHSASLAEQCPNGALELIKWENVNHSSGPTRSEIKWPYVSEVQDFVGGGKIAQ